MEHLDFPKWEPGKDDLHSILGKFDSVIELIKPDVSLESARIIAQSLSAISRNVRFLLGRPEAARRSDVTNVIISMRNAIEALEPFANDDLVKRRINAMEQRKVMIENRIRILEEPIDTHSIPISDLASATHDTVSSGSWTNQTL
ncbi:MAG: hypothetical protein K9M03_04710 [Kiritimatiellales bacterium]|nr:hypothetical protein [Kiritimatiellales bacterium]